jgi:cation-transporting ATPase 13A1
VKDLHRNEVESELQFAGFLVFFCPLKPDAKSAVKSLNHSSHRVIMITGDNALTACHVAKEVQISRRNILIGDIRENKELEWWTIDESIKIKMDPIKGTISKDILSYDLCVTGNALSVLETSTVYAKLLPRIWIYARTSPSQKEMILMRLKLAGYVTLMAGDGTNDVGALKQSHIGSFYFNFLGVALLDGNQEDLEKLAARLRERHRQKLLEKQEQMRKQWGMPPTPGQANQNVSFIRII